MSETCHSHPAMSPEVTRQEGLAIFTRQFSHLVDAGVHLVNALTTLEEVSPRPFGQAAQGVREKVEGGAVLSRSLRDWPGLFPPLYVRLIQLGELGGNLDEMLSFVADLLEEAQEIGAWGSAAGWKLPTAGLQPPAQEWSALTAEQHTFILLVFCRTFGGLFSLGIPLQISLETAAELLPTESRDAVRDSLRAPALDPVPAPLSRLPFLSPAVARFMAAGEHSGSLNHAMNRAADLCRTELRWRLGLPPNR